MTTSAVHVAKRFDAWAETFRSRSTAFHEAGHAVAHLRAGISFRYVTVRPRTEGVDGLIHRGRSLPWETPGLAYVILAGPVAEGIAFRLSDGRGSEEHAIRAAVTSIGAANDVRDWRLTNWDDARPGNLDEALAATLDSVREDWDGVAGVAHALLTRGTLTSREVKEIMQ